MAVLVGMPPASPRTCCSPGLVRRERRRDVRLGPLRGEATWAAGARPAPAITTLHDQTGHRFSLSSLRGHTVAMEFFDSHCTQECPLAGRALAAAERALPAAQRPVLVVVSVNPLDTPASTRAAIRAWGLAGVGPWHWLMGTHAQLAPVWKAYHIFVQPTRRRHQPHRGALPDRPPRRRALRLPVPVPPGAVAHDMRVLAGPQARRAMPELIEALPADGRRRAASRGRARGAVPRATT